MKKYILALLFALNLAPALAQAPPPVPALPDAERRTSYSITATTCACSVGFQLYGDSTDVDAWLAVWINGVKYLSTDPTHGWVITSATGPLATIPRPITNAVLTFNSAQTGTVQIVGSRRPRRASQFSENRGVAARDLNQVLTDNIATERERWDTVQQRIIQAPPGETLSVLPPVATRKGSLLGFDVNGNTQLFPPANVTGAGGGNMVGPVVATPGNLPLYGSSPNILTDSGTSLSSITSSLSSLASTDSAIKLTIEKAIGINIADFNVDPTGSADSLDGIQAAIDCSYGTGTNPTTGLSCAGNTAGITFCSLGTYKTTLPIFVDPPGNLRGSAAAWASGTTYAINNIVRFRGVPFISLHNSNTNHSPQADVDFLPRSGPLWWQQTTAVPSVAAQQAVFYGTKGLGNGGALHGCTIKPTFNSNTWMWISNGQGNYASNFAIQGPGFFNGWGCTLWPDGTGISIAGGGGGASFTKIENVTIQNIYSGIRTGQNQDSLGDSNTFEKVAIGQTCVGLYISQTQNQINSVRDSTISGAKWTISSQSGPHVKVYGGNLSPNQETAPTGAFTIGSTSALTRFNASSGFGYSFTTTVTSPDLAMQQCQYAECPYNVFTIVTANMGIIGLALTGFNASTNVASFTVSPMWSSWNYWAIDAKADSDLQAEIQAATTLYATQQTLILAGCGITAYGTFIETSDATFGFAQSCAFGTGYGIKIDSVPMGDASHIQANVLNGTTGAALAPFLTMNAFPFSYGSVQMSNISTGIGGLNGSLIWDAVTSSDVISLTGVTTGTVLPNIRTIGSNAGDLLSCSAAWLCGTWDPNPFRPTADGFSLNNFSSYLSTGVNAVPYKGWYPAPYAIPRLRTADITALLGTLPTLPDAYPFMSGGSIYQTINLDGTISGGTHLFAQSAHAGFTYGQDFTTVNVSGSAWSYKGQTKVVYMSSGLMPYMFPGLVIGLDNGGGNAYYTVTGVYPRTCKNGSCATYTGYVTVGGLNTQNSTLLAGTKTTVYTGTTVKQQAYSITQYP